MTECGARLAGGELTAIVSGHEAAYLDLEASTSVAYYSFVFGDDVQLAEQFRRHLFDAGVADFSPPYGRMLLVGGHPVGMYSLLSYAALRDQRLASALAAGRFAPLRGDAALRDRLHRASRVALRATPTDHYLARIAVSPDGAGSGYGRALLQHAVDAATAAGASRLVLDVAADNARALAFYERASFVQFGAATVDGGVGGRTLSYAHLGRDLA